MPLDDMIGFDSEQEKFAEIVLPGKTAIQAIKEAVWKMSKTILNGIDPDEGYQQVLFPGPVLGYERNEQTGEMDVSIWRNKGKEYQTQELYDALAPYSSSE